MSDVAGSYSALVPASWPDVSATANADGGYSGHLEHRFLQPSDPYLLPALLVRRTIELQLELQIAPEFRSLLTSLDGMSIGVDLVQAGSAGFFADEQSVHRFPALASHVQRLRVTCDRENCVRWFAFPSAGGRLPIREDLLPDSVDRVESRCVVGPNMFLSGEAVDESGRPVGNLPLTVWLDERPSWRSRIFTDDRGAFAMLVKPGAHGLLGAGRDSDPLDTPWAAGATVQVRAEIAKRICVQVLASDGTPTPSPRTSVTPLLRDFHARRKSLETPAPTA